MKNIFYTRNQKGFTLIETLISTTIIMLVILGPLSVAISSSAYAKNTKDTIISVYLAQEGLELLRFKRDSIFLECLNGLVTCESQMITAGVYENVKESAWRIFKERMGPYNSLVSCFASDTPEGCSYDIYGFTKTGSDAGERYVASDPLCDHLVRDDSKDREDGSENGVTDYMYLCKANGPGFADTTFSRTIKLYSLSEIGDPFYDQNYEDDLRVESAVTYVRSNGIKRTMKVVDYLHSRP